MSAARRCLSMKKGEDSYVFWFHEGQESDLLSAFLTLADDETTSFDWFDAAVMSYQLGRPLSRETLEQSRQAGGLA